MTFEALDRATRSSKTLRSRTFRSPDLAAAHFAHSERPNHNQNPPGVRNAQRFYNVPLLSLRAAAAVRALGARRQYQSLGVLEAALQHAPAALVLEHLLFQVLQRFLQRGVEVMRHAQAHQ